MTMTSYCDNYFDNPVGVHPSEPNYIWLEAGDNLGVTDDNDPPANHQSTTQHLATQLTAAGVTWAGYAEGIDGTICPINTDDANNYAPKHVPFVFFDDIVENPPSTSAPVCLAHMKPYTNFANDLQNNAVAQYNFITPNLCDDMHDTCAAGDSIAQGDTWLASELPKILASNAYKNNGAVFITWDESENGEFPIGMIVLSPLAKGSGYVGHTMYYHSSMLRTVETVFGVSPFLRDAANQPDLGDLFTKFP
jgi:phosphatidylinositol-3-phosphatase